MDLTGLSASNALRVVGKLRSGPATELHRLLRELEARSTTRDAAQPRLIALLRRERDGKDRNAARTFSSSSSPRRGIKAFLRDVKRRDEHVKAALNKAADKMVARGLKRLERSAPRQLSSLAKGDWVRLRLNAGLACAEKRPQQEWSSAMYTVSLKHPTKPHLYKVRRQDGRWDAALSRNWVPRTLLLSIPRGKMPREG